MALAENRRLRALDLDVELRVAHATGIGVGEREVAQVGLVLFGQLDVVRVHEL
jgi:hypothetical protein